MIKKLKVYQSVKADRDVMIERARRFHCGKLRDYDDESLKTSYELAKWGHSFIFNISDEDEPTPTPTPTPYPLTFEEYKAKRFSSSEYKSQKAMYDSIPNRSEEKLNELYFELAGHEFSAIHKSRLYKVIPELSDKEGGSWVYHRVTDSYFKVLALCNKYFISLSRDDKELIKSWLSKGYAIHVDWN